jgi:hypothetical protein
MSTKPFQEKTEEDWPRLSNTGPRNTCMGVEASPELRDREGFGSSKTLDKLRNYV